MANMISSDTAWDYPVKKHKYVNPDYNSSKPSINDLILNQEKRQIQNFIDKYFASIDYEEILNLLKIYYPEKFI